MGIPLQLVPYVAQKEIIKSMYFDNIFLLSLTSRKTCRVIQTLTFNTVTHIKYFMHEAGITLSIKTNDEREYPVVGLTELPGRIYIDNEMVTFEIGGVVKQYFMVYRPPDFCYLYFDSISQITMNNLFLDHLKNLFRQTVPIELSVSAKKKYAHAYQPIEGVQKLSIETRGVNRQAIDYIASHQSLITLVVHGKLTNEFNAPYPNVHLRNAAEHGKRILESFEGRNLVLYDIELSSKDVSKFGEKWQKSKAYQNLEFVELKLAEGQTVYDENQILRGIEVSEENNRPANFTPLLAFGNRVERSTERFRNIVRSEDNKVASFRITDAKFCAVIWHRTCSP
ncbi:hypothetical protein CAEBREN_22701 [Caenorhabditis brenneri]|uniref:F-box domain-containing protein n=1 Tax=Caenorhabditis brenneri TaxID=135651 RepID=G0P2T9_CAEBE|nr:hypothetical protein CAEBREN_22701 [Caenorhabditis brenneri]